MTQAGINFDQLNILIPFNFIIVPAHLHLRNRREITDHVVDVVVWEVQEANKQYNTPNMQPWAYSAFRVDFSFVETRNAKPQCSCVHDDVGCFIFL